MNGGALAAAARRVWNCVAHTFLFLATWQWLGGPVDMGVVRECIERVVQQQRPPEVHFRGRPEFHWRAGALATWIFPVQAFIASISSASIRSMQIGPSQGHRKHVEPRDCRAQVGLQGILNELVVCGEQGPAVTFRPPVHQSCSAGV